MPLYFKWLIQKILIAVDIYFFKFQERLFSGKTDFEVLLVHKPHFQVGAEIPMDSSEAEEENKQAGGKTLLYVLERGWWITDFK